MESEGSIKEVARARTVEIRLEVWREKDVLKGEMRWDHIDK